MAYLVRLYDIDKIPVLRIRALQYAVLLEGVLRSLDRPNRKSRISLKGLTNIHAEHLSQPSAVIHATRVTRDDLAHSIGASREKDWVLACTIFRSAIVELRAKCKDRVAHEVFGCAADDNRHILSTSRRPPVVPAAFRTSKTIEDQILVSCPTCCGSQLVVYSEWPTCLCWNCNTEFVVTDRRPLQLEPYHVAPVFTGANDFTGRVRNGNVLFYADVQGLRIAIRTRSFVLTKPAFEKIGGFLKRTSDVRSIERRKAVLLNFANQYVEHHIEHSEDFFRHKERLEKILFAPRNDGSVMGKLIKKVSGESISAN